MNKYTASFRYLKASAIQIAYDLFYDIDVIKKLDQAKTPNELTKILREARLDED